MLEFKLGCYNKPDKTLLGCSTLSGGLPLNRCKLSPMGSPGLLLSDLILSLLSDKLLNERGELGRLSHLGLCNSSSCW